MFKIKKLLVASLATASLAFSASICASAAQIDCLSIVDNTIYASTNAENARLYAVEYDGVLLSDVFFKDIAPDGEVELPVDEASEYALYLWDKESLAPVSASYKLIDGRAYPEGSETPLPEYEFYDYSFNQEDDVMIVSAISETQITGFKAGVEVTYPLTDKVTVVGLSDDISDVVPGSVVLTGTNRVGKCSAIELLASLGMPINPDNFITNYGVYDAADGSTRYKNIVDVMFSKGNTTMTLRTREGQKYIFESGSVLCYRVGIAMNGETPVITYTAKPISEPKATSVFPSTAEYYSYVYLRLDTEKSKTSGDITYDAVVTQCVLYCVPKNYDFTQGDGEYSGIFGLEPIVIIE